MGPEPSRPQIEDSCCPGKTPQFPFKSETAIPSGRLVLNPICQLYRGLGAVLTHRFDQKSSVMSSPTSLVAPSLDPVLEPAPDLVPNEFVLKTCLMVDHERNDHLVSWSNEGKIFCVWKPTELGRDVLSKYFTDKTTSRLSKLGFKHMDFKN